MLNLQSLNHFIMKPKMIILIGIPVLTLVSLLFLTYRTTENVRYSPPQTPQVNSNDNTVIVDGANDSSDNTNVASKVSKIQDENAFPIETRSEKIGALETKILSEGSGEKVVGPNSTITVNYRGWIASTGKVFDSSFKGGKTEGVSFNVKQVIQGWTRGTQGMKVGEVRRLFIPSDLGYGAAGAGADIPPNSDLIFDVEVLSIN